MKTTLKWKWPLNEDDLKMKTDPKHYKPTLCPLNMYMFVLVFLKIKMCSITCDCDWLIAAVWCLTGYKFNIKDWDGYAADTKLNYSLPTSPPPFSEADLTLLSKPQPTTNNNNNKVYFAQTDGKRQSKAPNAHNLMSTIQNTRQSPHSPSVTE